MKKIIKISLACTFLMQGLMTFSIGLMVRSEFPTEVSVTLENGRVRTKKIEGSSGKMLELIKNHIFYDINDPHQLVVDAFFEGLYESFESISWKGLDGNTYKVKFEPLNNPTLKALSGITNVITLGGTLGFTWGAWHNATIFNNNRVRFIKEGLLAHEEEWAQGSKIELGK